jgi:LysR family pca operon transcriptional activator
MNRFAHRLQHRHLAMVEAVASHRTLLQAARTVGVSQPALTKTIQTVEALIGVQLFARSPRGMLTTPYGEAVAQTARLVRAELLRLEQEIARLSGVSRGTVVVGALPTAMAGILPGALARLRTLYPGLEVRLIQGRTEELLPLLMAGDVELIVGRLYALEAADSLLRESLYDEPISVLARADHPLFHLAAVPPGLGGYGLILPTVSQRVGKEIEHLLAGVGRTSDGALRATSGAFIREMLHTSDMVAVVPRMTMAGDLMRGTVRIIGVGLPDVPRPAGTIQIPGRPLQEGAAALVACLRGYLAELADEGVVTIHFSYTAAPENDKTRAATVA